jgi:hypothetical protein
VNEPMGCKNNSGLGSSYCASPASAYDCNGCGVRCQGTNDPTQNGEYCDYGPGKTGTCLPCPAPTTTACVNPADFSVTCTDLTSVLTCGKDCVSNIRCPLGATCEKGDGTRETQCVCPAGQVKCGANPGACVNLMTDPANCGQCFRACAAGESCQGGSCGIVR